MLTHTWPHARLELQSLVLGNLYQELEDFANGRLCHVSRRWGLGADELLAKVPFMPHPFGSAGRVKVNRSVWG